MLGRDERYRKSMNGCVRVIAIVPMMEGTTGNRFVMLLVRMIVHIDNMEEE